MMPMDAASGKLEAHESSYGDGKKDAELSSSAAQHHNGIRQKGPKINHGSDSDKQ